MEVQIDPKLMIKSTFVQSLIFKANTQEWTDPSVIPPRRALPFTNRPRAFAQWTKDYAELVEDIKKCVNSRRFRDLKKIWILPRHDMNDHELVLQTRAIINPGEEGSKSAILWRDWCASVGWDMEEEENATVLGHNDDDDLGNQDRVEEDEMHS